MARRGSPALYELLGRGRESKTTPVIPVNIPPRSTGRSGRGGLSVGPGSTGAKVPSGAPTSGGTGPATAGLAGVGAGKPGFSVDPQVAKLIGFAIAAGIVLLGVYWLGVARGTSNAVGGPTASGGSASVVPSGSALSEQDQLAASNPGVGAADSRPSPGPSARQSSVGGSSAQAAAGSAAAAGSPAGQTPGVPAAAPRLSPAATNPDLGPALPPAQRGIDPRQSGLNYYVIASVAEANADKLVAFCRERGLDAWVVPDHNGRLREITVLPGIPSSEKKGAVAKALEERIRKVGLQWQATARGNSDFDDRYLKLFNG